MYIRTNNGVLLVGTIFITTVMHTDLRITAVLFITGSVVSV